MLVLSRKLNEKIIIDDEIIISVVRIDNKQVRIGIEAPRSVSVMREEIHASRSDSPLPCSPCSPCSN
jgi:carbon storage regulator